MYPWGRRARPFHDPKELLYLRFRPADLVNGEIPPTSMPFPTWCANRSRFSQPLDVLIPNWPDWKVAAFAVEAVPQQLKTEPETKKVGGKRQAVIRTFLFVPVHLPEPDNYAHSEVQSFEDGNPGEMAEPPKTLKKKFRTMLSERARFLD